LPSLGLVLGITYQTVRHRALSNNISRLIYYVCHFEHHVRHQESEARGNVGARARARGAAALPHLRPLLAPPMLSTKVLAFTTYVRPLLEHNSVVWFPYLKSDIELIVIVQRRFTKRLNGVSELSYDGRLKLLNLERVLTAS